ncbi:MAG TPA: hypothetical protein VGG85_08650 [Terracidiphilus sp.]|jgi:hypothetical protein
MEADRLSQSTAPAAAFAGLRHKISLILALFAGAALRFWMLHKVFEADEDSHIYGGIARNLILHGRYAISDGSGALHATLIRLPGYPFFLALCFRLFGMENYFSATIAQILLDLVGCALLALVAFRISPVRIKRPSAHATLWLASLCPFTAVYAAEPLTEGLTFFCIALALWSAARFLDWPNWPSALAFTFAVTYAALLRPDGLLVGLVLAPPLCLILLGRKAYEGDLTGGGKAPQENQEIKRHDLRGTADAAQESRASAPAIFRTRRSRLRLALVCMLLAATPFAAWTVRNWRVFHVIQPLAPRYANDPGEETDPGFQRWVKTWCLDFISTEQVYWNEPDNPIDVGLLPARAFDSPAQYAETKKLAADYAANGYQLSPQLDARFDQLARERIDAHPLRYFLWMPLGRVADMWLRPRVENLPIDLDWWVYDHHNAETRFSWFYVALNAFYLLLGFTGLWLRPRLGLSMLAYFVLRSAMLMTIEAPEARYTLECFPMLFVLGGIALGRLFAPR